MRGHGIEIGALALLAATGWAGMASAQTPDIPSVVSPLRVETDHNNVNLISGKTSIDGPALGVPAAPNLRFDRVQNAAPYVRGTITGQAGQTVTGSYAVHAGGAASEAFRCLDYDCESVTGTGSTFRPSGAGGRGAAVYRQAGSGARYALSVRLVNQAGPPSLMQYYAASATWPNGETITYSYNTASLPGQASVTYRRPIRLQSNLGYHITISYHPGELGTMEWNSPFQATLYADAAPTVPLQQQTYSADGTTITDLGGRSWSCASCRNAMGSDIETAVGSLQLPGEGAATLQVASAPPPPGLPGLGLVGSVNRDGVTWNYAYAGVGYAVGGNLIFNQVSVTGPDGFNQVYAIAQSDQRNVIDRMTDSLGRVTDFTFDSAYRVTRIVYPEGNEVSVTYDPQGNIIERRAKARPGAGSAPDLVQTVSYPEPPGGIPNMCDVACWRPTWSRDARGQQTDYLYNADGQLTQQDDPVDAQGVRRRTIIDYVGGRRSAVRLCGVGPGAATTCGTSAEHRTEYQYWQSTFLITRERRIDGATAEVLDTHYDYDPAGRLVMTDGPLPGQDDATYARYDVHGRRTWEIGARAPDGLRTATRTTYRDADDKPVLTETGTIPSHDSAALTVQRSTALAYDARRNPEREVVTAQGQTFAVTERRFDLSNRSECEAQRMNPASFGAMLPNPCLPGTEASDGPDRITKNIYDAAGQRLQVRVGVGSGVEAAEATWAYNLNGQITRVIDGNGNRAGLFYDRHMRQSCWMMPSTTRPSNYIDTNQTTALASAGNLSGAIVNDQCASGDYEAYSYDANGNRLTHRKRDGSTLSFQYDNLNRVLVKVVPERSGLDSSHTRDVHYGYDLRNLPLYARFDSHTGPGVVNNYDGFGRLAWTESDVGGVARRLSYQYDPAGNRTGITHPDGQWFEYEYDGRSRLTGIDENGSSDIAALSYHPTGELYALGRGSSALGWLYDDVGRMRYQVADLPDGNGTSWTFTRNPASGLSSVTRSNDDYAWTGHYAVNRGYTTDGLNRYSAAGGATFAYDLNGNLISDGTRTYTYDVENRLVAASGGVQLSYDPLGRLAWTTGSPTFARFLWDGDALVAEYDFSNALTERYVHGTAAGADDPVFWYHGAAVTLANRRLLFADERGSVVAVTDAVGNRLNVNRYDEYGIPAAGNTGRFQYTGQIWLPELGMYHYKARIYSPTLGRFLQTDPIGYEDQFNLYAYVGNDPVNATDPSGEDRVVCNVTSGNGAVSVSCVLSPDDSSRTSVTYNITRNFTDANGESHSSTESRQQTFEGSISQEGIVSRVLSGTGNQIVTTIERNLSAFAGAEVRPFTRPSNGSQIGEFLRSAVDSTVAAGGSGFRNLGNLRGRANDLAGVVARERGASAQVVRHMGHWADRPLGEVSRAAAAGDQSARTAIKLVKEAGRLGERY